MTPSEQHCIDCQPILNELTAVFEKLIKEHDRTGIESLIEGIRELLAFERI